MNKRKIIFLPFVGILQFEVCGVIKKLNLLFRNCYKIQSFPGNSQWVPMSSVTILGYEAAIAAHRD